MTNNIQEFLEVVVQWAEARSDVLALVLVGSYARGTPTPSSDVDLVLISTQPQDYLVDTNWATHFGTIEKSQIEDWSRVTSLRVWYTDGKEIEFGFTSAEWAAQPLDEGTRRTINDGIKILLDRDKIFSGLV